MPQKPRLIFYFAAKDQNVILIILLCIPQLINFGGKQIIHLSYNNSEKAIQ